MDALRRLEKELLPLAVCNEWVELPYLIEAFPEYAVSLLEEIGNTEFSVEDFSVKKYSVKYSNATYYIIILHFPFIRDRAHVTLANRAFIVIAPGRLQKIHYFLSEMEERISSEGKISYVFVVKEYIPDGEELVIRLAKDRIPEGHDDDMPINTTIWAYKSEFGDSEKVAS